MKLAILCFCMFMLGVLVMGTLLASFERKVDAILFITREAGDISTANFTILQPIDDLGKRRFIRVEVMSQEKTGL